MYVVNKNKNEKNNDNKNSYKNLKLKTIFKKVKSTSFSFSKYGNNKILVCQELFNKLINNLKKNLFINIYKILLLP